MLSHRQQIMLQYNICDLLFFFFNDTATTEIYTLSLHDALPIFDHGDGGGQRPHRRAAPGHDRARLRRLAHRRRSEEHTSELQSPCNLVCRLLLEKKKITRPKCALRLHSPLTTRTVPLSSRLTDT